MSNNIQFTTLPIKINNHKVYIHTYNDTEYGLLIIWVFYSTLFAKYSRLPITLEL